MGWPSGMEWIVIGIVAVLVFGGRLPEVGKTVGKTLRQLRRGLDDLKHDIDLGDDLDVARDVKDLGRELRDSAITATEPDQSHDDAPPAD